MKKVLTAILAGFIAVAGIYAQTASFDEGYWIAPAPVLSAPPLPSLFFPDDATIDNDLQPMQAGTAVEWPPSAFSVGLNLTFLFNFRGIDSLTIHEGTTTTEFRYRHGGGIGIGAFFDARYVELAAGISIVQEGVRQERPGGTDVTSAFSPALDVSLLFKLPLELPSGLPEGYFFPLLGVGYNALLLDPFRNLLENSFLVDTFRIPFGVGLDVSIGNNTFFRTSVLAHYTFALRFIQDSAVRNWAAAFSGNWGIGLVMGVGFGL